MLVPSLLAWRTDPFVVYYLTTLINKMFGTRRACRESNSILNYPTQALYLFYDRLVACIVQFTVFTVFGRIFISPRVEGICIVLRLLKYKPGPK